METGSFRSGLGGGLYPFTDGSGVTDFSSRVAVSAAARTFNRVDASAARPRAPVESSVGFGSRNDPLSRFFYHGGLHHRPRAGRGARMAGGKNLLRNSGTPTALSAARSGFS